MGSLPSEGDHSTDCCVDPTSFLRWKDEALEVLSRGGPVCTQGETHQEFCWRRLVLKVLFIIDIYVYTQTDIFNLVTATK